MPDGTASVSGPTAALGTIADDRTVRPQVRQLALDLAGRVEEAMRRHAAANRITMTLQRAENR